jgi:hypothetical protein
MSSAYCPLCKQGVSLYKCPKCGLTGHVDVEAKTVTLHMQILDTTKKVKPRGPPSAFSVPSHADCEFAKPINQISLDKLEKVTR